MLEARIEKAELLKKILDAIKELVTDANWDCSEEGLKLQAMDNSHIALVALDLQTDAFMDDGFRCDRNMSLGMNLGSLTKILKCAGNEDEVSLRADDDSDVLSLTFQDRKRDRMGEYEMKLMDIDQEHLGIPDTAYEATVKMPSSEFLRIVRDIKELGESVKIEVTKEGVKFSAEGDIGTAAVTLRPTKSGRPVEAEDDDDEENGDDGSEGEQEDGDDDNASKAAGSDVEMSVKDEDENEGEGVKKAKANGSRRKRITDDDEDEEEDVKPDPIEISDGEGDAKESKKRARSDSEASEAKPAKKTAAKKKKTETKKKAPAKKATNGKVVKGKGKKKSEDDEEAREIIITIAQSVSLTFSIKYLTNFAKSTPLSPYVTLHMSAEVPLLVEYAFTGGSIRYYLAPKIADD